MKNKKNEEFYLKRFQEVVCFLTAQRIHKNFGSLKKYHAAKTSSKAFHLNIKWSILETLSKFGNSKHFNSFLAKSEHLFRYNKHCHKKFKSNKRFSRNSWFELSNNVLENFFESTEASLDMNTSKFLSKESHKFIDKHVYKYEKTKKDINKDKDMTKADEEKIRQECAEGKHACSADYLIKERKKDERRAEKAAQKRMDKSNVLLQKQLDENKALKEENAALKARISELEQECAATIEKLDEANEKLKRLYPYTRELKTKYKALEKKLAGTSSCSQDVEAQEDVPKAPDKVIDNARLDRTIAKGFISSAYAKKLADVLGLSAHEFTPTPFWGWPDTCRNIHFMKDLLQGIIDNAKWYVPDNNKLEKLKKEVQSFESRILEERKMIEAEVKRREAEAEADKTAKLRNAQVVAEAYARAQLKDAKQKAEAEIQSLKTPPIAVPKPQSPAVTDENADAVLEELGF